MLHVDADPRMASDLEPIQMLAVRTQKAVKVHECDVIGCDLGPINPGDLYNRYAFINERGEFEVSKQHREHYN